VPGVDGGPVRVRHARQQRGHQHDGKHHPQGPCGRLGVPCIGCLVSLASSGPCLAPDLSPQPLGVPCTWISGQSGQQHKGFRPPFRPRNQHRHMCNASR
jgi:hypothetical protein